MNYSKPRELKDEQGNPTGRWHYTTRNSAGTRPLGYCAQGCPGHDSKEGAYEHYRQYLLDSVAYNGTYHNEEHKCSVCGAWTGNFAQVDETPYTLCDEHRNRKTLDTILKAGDSFGSW